MLLGSCQPSFFTSSFVERKPLSLCSESINPYCQCLPLFHQASVRGCTKRTMLAKSRDFVSEHDQGVGKNTAVATKPRREDVNTWSLGCLGASFSRCVTCLRLAVVSFPLLVDSHSDFLQQDRRYGYPRLDRVPPLSPAFLRLLLVERSALLLSELAEKCSSSFYKSYLSCGESRKRVKWDTLATWQHLSTAALQELDRLRVQSAQSRSRTLKQTGSHDSQANSEHASRTGEQRMKVEEKEERGKTGVMTELGCLKCKLESRSTNGGSGGGGEPETRVSNGYSWQLWQRLANAHRYVKVPRQDQEDRQLNILRRPLNGP